MSDIKVGDWVKHAGWGKFYEVVKSQDNIITVVSDWGNEYSYSLDEYEFTIRDNPTSSPVREVVTKELVDGVYGRVAIDTDCINTKTNPIFIRLLDRRQQPIGAKLGFNAKELRELAKTFNEVAEFLEGE